MYLIFVNIWQCASMYFVLMPPLEEINSSLNEIYIILFFRNHWIKYYFFPILLGLLILRPQTGDLLLALHFIWFEASRRNLKRNIMSNSIFESSERKEKSQAALTAIQLSAAGMKEQLERIHKPANPKGIIKQLTPRN